MGRYTRGEIVINASKRQKSTGVELRLPAMSALTSKGSSQQFFLRILKVVIQLRNSVLSAAKPAAGTAATEDAPPRAAADAESTEAVADTASESHSERAAAAAQAAGADAASDGAASEASPNAMEVDTGQWWGQR